MTSTTMTSNLTAMGSPKSRRRSKSFRESLSSITEAVRVPKISVGLGTKIIASAPTIGSTTSTTSSTATSPISTHSPVSPVSPVSPISPSSGQRKQSFTTYRVRVYAKEGRDYRYMELQSPQAVPTIEISPPDDAPYRLSAAGRPGSAISRSSSFPAQSVNGQSFNHGHRRAMSFETEKPLPPLPLQPRRVSAPTLSHLDTSCAYPLGAISELEGSLASEVPTPPEFVQTPPDSPTESLTIPAKFSVDEIERVSTPPHRMPPSPPVSPDSPHRGMSTDSLSWLERELAISDGEFEEEEGESKKEERQPFIDFSPPSSPFSREFPEYMIENATTITVDLKHEQQHGRREGGNRTPRNPKASLTQLPPEILVQIFLQLPSVAEVTALSLSNSGLHRVFQEHAATIIPAAATRQLSLALRDLLSIAMLQPSIAEYAAAIAHLNDTAAAIKSAIRKRCKNFLSKHLLNGDEEAFDSAIFNVWQFSARFSARIGEREEQVAWLRSRQDLCMQELRDMLEVYQCIGVLLCPLTTDLSLATKAGVVQDLGPGQHLAMEEAVELWVVHLQSLDLQTLRPVLEVEEEDEAGRWDAIVREGLWCWDNSPDRIRKTQMRLYLKGAVSEVYKDLSAMERRKSLEEKWGVEGVWGETCEI